MRGEGRGGDERGTVDECICGGLLVVWCGVGEGRREEGDGWHGWMDEGDGKS